MGMVDKENLAGSTEQKPVQFASDRDIDAVLNEMDDEKQPFDRPEIKEEPELFETEEAKISPSQKRRSNQTAAFVVSTIDKTLATGFAMWAKSDNVKDFEADPTDIDELAEYWGVYFADKDIDLPPWVMAAVVSFIVLSKKFNHATHVRKLNLQIEAEQKQNKELKAEIEKLKKEKEVESLKDELERLKGGKKA